MSTYRIARRLSEAASVLETFVGLQELPPRPVVLKRLVTPWTQNADFAQRYLGAANQWPHGPGLPELYEVGHANGNTYLVQELIEGESVRHVMNALGQRKGFIAPAEGLAIVARMAHLLADLHARTPAVVHGDVCASTTMLTPRGEVFLLDAGVAAAAGSTPALGPARAEPHSLAPEQLTEQVVPATDVFRLGLVLYELALGRPLFGAADATQALVLCQRFTGLTRDALKQVPEPYASLLIQMLAVEPRERPSLEEVDAVLQQASAKAGWKTPELDIGRLFSRACADRVSLAGSLPRDGHQLTLTPLASGPGERPAVTPPGSAVVARIATRKMSRTELDAVRAPPSAEVARLTIETVDDGHGPRDVKLGAALVDKRLLTKTQLEEALDQVSTYGGTLSDALEAMGVVDEDVIVATLGELTKTPVVNSKKLRDMQPQPEALKLVPLGLARALDLVPLALKGGTQLLVGMKNPMDAAALEQLKAASGLKSIVAMRGGERAIRRTRNRFYTGKEEDDVADWIERGSSPSSLMHAPAASSGSGIFTATVPPSPAPMPPPATGLRVVDPSALTGSADHGAAALASLRVVDTLLALLGDKGRQAWQLVTVALAVGERLGVSDADAQRLKVAGSALVAANLRDGRPPWDVPTIEALSGVLGPAWDDYEPLIGPLLDFPASVPNDAPGQALFVAVAFATHVGQARPLPQVAAQALTSFQTRFRLPQGVVTALAGALNVPG